MLVTIENLQVAYGKQTALRIKEPIQFQKGDRIGIIGSNGAGKSTLVKAVLGLVPYKGFIRTILKPEEIAVHMQFNNYPSTMPVKVILETILYTKIKTNSKLTELIRYFEFEGCLHKRFSSLSGGQKQRLTIIMVMMQDAPLTFYDEVTSGLDFETRQRLMQLLADWYGKKENTLCIVSHYYEELELLVDKLLILEKGEVVDYGDKDALFNKYCGKAIIIVDNNETNRRRLDGYHRLCAPDHLLAVSCKDETAEKELISLLVDENVNFKRSSNDIEIMSTNAKAVYFAERKERGAS